jgi:hypothetical protein
MNHIDSDKCNLGLSVLNASIGLCFADMPAEQAKPTSNADTVQRLKARFGEYYARRVRLAWAKGVAQHAIIERAGQHVHGRGLTC